MGDVIGISFGARTLRVRVLDIPEFATKAGASLLYEELPEE